jgi:hypothetical protein
MRITEEWLQGKKGWIAAALFLFSFLLYSQALQHKFVWDDEGVFVKDQNIRSLLNIPDFFVNPLVLTGGADPSAEKVTRLKYYRPLLSSLHALEHRLFGQDPFYYKGLNLVLNGLVVVAAYYLVSAVTGSLMVATIASFLYAAVPARAEVVYWTYSDSHLLAALFTLLCLHAFISHRSLWAYLSFLVALFFQEGAIVIPLLLCAYALLIEQKGPRWRELTFYFIGIFFYLILRYWVTGGAPPGGDDPWLISKAAPLIITKLLQIWLWPDALCTIYLFRPQLFTGFYYQASNLVSFVYILFGVWLYRKDKKIFFWLVWFQILISLAFNVGGYVDYFLAEKTLFLSSLGLSVLVAWTMVHAGQLFRRGVVLAVAVLFIFGTGMTWARATCWTDSITYLEGLARFEPDSTLVRGALANYYLKENRFAEAIFQYATALSLSPNNKAIRSFLGSAWVQWGRSLAQEGNTAEALKKFKKALAYTSDKSLVWNSIGNVLYIQGDVDAALSAWQNAFILDPKNVEARSNLIMFRAQKTPAP